MGDRGNGGWQAKDFLPALIPLHRAATHTFPVTKPEIIQRLLKPGIIAILRAQSSAQLVAVTEALLRGGVTAVEVTMTTPGALQVISDVVAHG